MKNLLRHIATFIIPAFLFCGQLCGQTISWQEKEYPQAKASIEVVATIKNTLDEPCYVMIAQEFYAKNYSQNEAIFRKFATRFGMNKLSLFLNNTAVKLEGDTVCSVPETFVKKLKPRESFELAVSTTRSQSVEVQRDLIKRLLIVPASVMEPLASNFEQVMAENGFLYKANKLTVFWGDLNVRYRSSRYELEDFYEWQRRIREPLIATAELPENPIVPSTDCDVPPRFPGGESALIDYLDESMKGLKDYTEEDGMPGRVTLTFIVELDGSIANIQDIKSTTGDLAKVAIRIAESMPRWSPALWHGKRVRSRYTLPMTFITH